MSGLRLPLLLLFVLLLGCIFASSGFLLENPVDGLAGCHAHHIQALVQFKNEFDSSGCNQTDFFNGAWCDNTTGVISKLQLPSGCLSGTLNPNSSLFQLQHLRYLNLSYNNFSSSSLPSGFGNLNKLEVLSLSHNGFIGQLPSSFSNLSKLSYLDLSHNDLTGSFPVVWNLSKLSALDVSGNLLSGALNPKSSLFEFHHLLYLNLAYNNLSSSSIPYEFGNLNRLEALSLSSNGFQGQVPSSFSNLSRLTQLYLDHNQLTGSFPLVQNITKLSILQLHNNHFSGAIPSSLLTMPFLSNLNLGGNHLTDPVEVRSSSTSSQLETLDLQHNPFEGKILELISNFTNLKYLDLSFLNIGYPIDIQVFFSLKSLVMRLVISGNSISLTSLSSDSDVLLNLERLGLSGCDMREFPNLKSLHSLEVIDISNNKIKGKVPEWLWNLPRLSTLYLLNNYFTYFEGSPEVLVNSSVRFLDLGLNHFKGPFPNPPLSIKLLSAWNNSFTGNIPLSVCNLSSLIVFDLSYNNLTGPIPPCLSNLRDSLTVVNLRKNKLEGSLPDMCYDGALLRTLDVGYNQLTGKLPRSLLNCSSLMFLSLDHNRMKGTFPFWLKALPVLQALTLRSNKFYGPISPPDQDPFAFPNLRILEISDNKFTGILPPNYFADWKASSLQMNEDGSIYMGIYNSANYIYEDTLDLQYKGLFMEQGKLLTSYATIDFSGNRLEGQIPESIGLLKALIALNLSNNAFTGHIPLSLANLTELESLDLSRNQLSGTIPNLLKSLSFLAYISVSHNELKGEIPQGTQIIGQSKSSFEGNAGLCGLPLDESCFDPNRPPTQQQLKQEDEVEEEEEVLNWKAVAIGYGPGVFLGLSIGQVIALYKPEWLVKITGLYKCRNR